MGLLNFLKNKVDSKPKNGAVIAESGAILDHLNDALENGKNAATYRRFSAPYEHNKALSLLSGIVQGLDGDGNISDFEMTELLNWCALHAHLQRRNPFSELIPMIKRALEDGVLTESEREDILWVCRKNYFGRDYYDDITNSLQVLCGYAHGLLADKELSDTEIHALSGWMAANDFLAGNYPFDEIDKKLKIILADGVITEDEREDLILLLSSLIDYDESLHLSKSDFDELKKKHTVSGICTPCPDMCLENKAVCFTGDSPKASYDELCQAAESCGAVVRQKVSGRTDYLIVGDAGSPAWAFSCYGRKIEKALELQKEGKKVQIVNETDFWNAVKR